MNSKKIQNSLLSFAIALSLGSSLYLNYQSRTISHIGPNDVSEINQENIEMQMPDVKVIDKMIQKVVNSVVL